MASTGRQTRGETSELEVAMHLIDQHGCRVSQTFGHSHPYDLIADKDGDLLKIQVKTVSNRRGNQQGTTIMNPDQYSPENVDLFAGQPKTKKEPFFVPCNEVDLNAGNPRIHVTYTSREDMGYDGNWDEAFHISDYRFHQALKRLQSQDFLDRKM